MDQGVFEAIGIIAVLLCLEPRDGQTGDGRMPTRTGRWRAPWQGPDRGRRQIRDADDDACQRDNEHRRERR